MAVQQIVTIGVYGFTSERFFTALLDARVDLFCDLRARRGVRGRDYAFANVRRLETTLSELGITYEHFVELAPTPEIRALQRSADAERGTAKRTRGDLDPAFVASYEILMRQPPAIAALEEIRRRSVRPALLCVERSPAACHRSLVAARLANEDGATIENIVP
jgi:uncharacterized protein (DUF488 family)